MPRRTILLWVTLVSACSDLPAIDSGVCGNGAVESGEDCDGTGSAGTCGAPSTVNACHFVCDSGATCPDGFVCGADTRCRSPSGAFATALGPYPFGASEFRAGDVDGDGFDDLVGIDANRVEVRFGVASGDLTAIADEVLPDATGPVDFDDLDGDGRLDLLVPTSIGVVTLRGSSARTFDPLPYASIALEASTGDIHLEPIQVVSNLGVGLLIAFDVLEVGGGAALHSQLRSISGGFGTCLDGSLVGPLHPADCPTTPLVGDLLGGDVTIGRTGFVWKCTPCTSVLDETPGFVPLASDESDEAVLAVKGAPTVALVSAAETNDAQGNPDDTTLTLRLAQTIAMPASHPVADDGAVAFADMDGDGCNDLVIPVVGGGTNIVFAIAYNDCAGNMASAVLVNAADVAGVTQAIGVVRAVTDLDGDGIADVVTDKQIILTTATRKQAAGRWKGTGFALAKRAWTRAVTTDINRDGNADIVAMVDGEPDVDILLNDQLLFNDFTVATADPVRFLMTGDFDGDLVLDVGIVTGDTTSASEDDALSLVFGNVAGGPSAPVDQGHFGVVRSIVPLFFNTSLQELDGVEDLVVVTDTTGGRKGAVVLGSTDRQVVAPFVVTGPPPPAQPPPPSSSPVAVVAGQFDATPDHDVLTLAHDPIDPTKLQVFLLSGTGGGDLDNVAQFTTSTDLSGLLDKPAPVFAHGPLASGAADSLVEVHSVGIGPNGTGQNPACPVASTKLVATSPPPPGVQPYDGPTTWDILPPAELPQMASSCQRIRALELADLDGDGVDETLVDVCDAMTGGPGNCVGAVIPTVAGAPDVAHPIGLPPTGLSCGRYAPIQLDADAAFELIAPCTGADGTFLVMLDQQNGTWVELGRIPIARTDDGRITIADFNGDKIPDVAIASGSGAGTQVTVYLQCAKGDTSCAR